MEQQVQDIQQEQELTEKASRLRILFRVAFICNIFFVVCMIMRFTTLPDYLPQPIIELSIILGWSAMFINLISFVFALILISRIRKRKIPMWLFYINIIFFLMQIYFFFIMHD